MPEHESDNVLADKFIEFFMNQIKVIRQNLDNKEKFKVPDYKPTYLTFILAGLAQLVEQWTVM